MAIGRNFKISILDGKSGSIFIIMIKNNAHAILLAILNLYTPGCYGNQYPTLVLEQ